MRSKAALGVGLAAGLLLGLVAGQGGHLAHGQQDGTELDTVVGAQPDGAMAGLGGAGQYHAFAWGGTGLVLLHTPTGQMWRFVGDKWSALPAAPVGASNRLR
jgi:hypothetical protein